MIEHEDFLWLKELSQKINTQDKRATSFPLFVVYDRVQVPNENGSERERKSSDYCDIDPCEKCAKLEEEGEELPDDCEDCDPECFNYFDWEDRICENDGIYLTAEACNEYIARRRYAFDKPYSYAISAYYSEEMKRLMTIISKLTLKPGDINPLK
jgi:Fe-S-cluster formation regulator IscX/YfhJ